MSLPQAASTASSNSVKQEATQKFLDQVGSVIKDFEKADDITLRNAVKQLQDIKTQLENESNKKASKDWVALGRNMLLAAQWMRFIYDFFQHHP